MALKIVKGWHVPDYDADLEKNISNGYMFAGRASYQLKFFARAFPIIQNFRNAVDIGAHIGLWSFVMGRCFERVTAFEPVPAHAECFRANNPNIKLHEVALGEADGSVEMTLRPPVSLKARVKTNELTDGFTVPVSRLDAFTLGDHIDFVKIDCEGYELNVIRGGEDTIRRNRPVIMVEQKPGNLSRMGIGTEAVDLLKSWGADVKFEMGGDWCLAWPVTA